MWNVTASVRVTALSLDDPSNRVRERAEWVVGKWVLQSPGGSKEYPNTMKVKTRIKEHLFPPQKTVFCVLNTNFLFFFQVAKGMSSIGMKKIFNPIICFDSILLGPEKKCNPLYTYCFCTDRFDNHCDQVWNHKHSLSLSAYSLITPHTQVDQLWCRLVLIIKRKKNQWNIWLALRRYSIFEIPHYSKLQKKKSIIFIKP